MNISCFTKGPLPAQFSLGLLFLGLGHYYSVNGGGHALFLPFNTVSWIPVLMLIAVASVRVGADGSLRYTLLTQRMLTACILLTVPLFYPAAVIEQSILRIAGLWTGFAFFIALQQSKLTREHVHYLFLFVLIGVCLEALRYWVEMFSNFSIARGFQTIESFKIFGVFQQRNVFASFVATGLVLSGYLLAYCKEWKNPRFSTAFMLLVPLLLMHILHAMASRAGWYGAIIGMVLILPFLRNRVGISVTLLWLGSCLLGINESWLMASFGDWSAPSKSILTLAGPRTILFSQALMMFFSKPLFGFGYGTFEQSYINYVAAAFQSGVLSAPSIPDTFHPHNEFLLWGVEGGLLPVAGLVIAAWSVWSQVMKIELLQRLAVIGLFVPITLHSQVEYPFYASVLHWITFILLIFYVDCLNSTKQVFGLPAPRIVGSLGVLSAGLGLVFLCITLLTGNMLARFNSGHETMGVLLEAKYPLIWEDRINWAINMNYLFRGVAEGNEDYVRQYITWAPGLIERQPRPLFLDYLIYANQIIDQPQQADDLIARFEYLFPENEFIFAKGN